jgi:hypothetical protein
MQRPAFFTLLVATVTACGGAAGPSTIPLWIPGVPQPVPSDQSGGAQVASLSRLAAASLGCSDVAVARRGTSDVLRVTGCGKQALYLRRIKYDYGREGESSGRLEFIDLAATAPASASLDGVGTAAALVALSARAAKDLACPRGDVVPEMRSLGRSVYVPVAEGCGRRVTYVPGVLAYRQAFEFQLAGRVDAPEEPTGFLPWDGS